MISWFAILLIIVVVILLWALLTGRMGGQTFTIIILLIILALLIIPAIIGIGIISFFKSMCLNDDCSQMKLPFNLEKINSSAPNANVYRVTPSPGNPYY